jgi:hypothetical protein
LGGAALLVWTIRTAGTDAVFAGVRRVGAGFALILVLGGLRYLCRATAWRLAFEFPDQVPFASSFAAVVAGDAVGNITPFGALISEPAKVLLISSRVSPQAGVASLAIENLFYSLTVTVMLVAGTISLLWVFHVDASLRAATFATLVVAIAVCVAGGWALATQRRFVSNALHRMLGWNFAPRYIERWRPRVAAIEHRVYNFGRRHPGRIVPIAAIEMGYHAAALAEIWLALTLITATAPGPMTALVLEYINRAITIAFQFVPLWLGVDEAGTGTITRVLGLGSAAGISLALVRKARIAVWTLAGIGLLAYRGISIKAAAAQNAFVAIDATGSHQEW